MPLYLSLFYFFIFLQCPHLYICIVCMYIWLNCIYLYLNVYCQCLMLTVCTKGLRVTQFQFSVCMYCTCGRIDNKADLTWLDLTEQPRPVNPKVEECVSWLTRNGVTPGISPLCRVPARLIWNIYPLFAAHSICPGSFHRSLSLLFTFHHRQTPAWLCLSFTMCSAATLTNILMLPLSSRGILTKPTSGR